MRKPRKAAPGGGADRETPSTSTAETAVHQHIGRQLKAMFDEVVSEPVPDKLQKLLEELARKGPTK